MSSNYSNDFYFDTKFFGLFKVGDKGEVKESLYRKQCEVQPHQTIDIEQAAHKASQSVEKFEHALNQIE